MMNPDWTPDEIETLDRAVLARFPSATATSAWLARSYAFDGLPDPLVMRLVPVAAFGVQGFSGNPVRLVDLRWGSITLSGATRDVIATRAGEWIDALARMRGLVGVPLPQGPTY